MILLQILEGWGGIFVSRKWKFQEGGDLPCTRNSFFGSIMEIFWNYKIVQCIIVNGLSPGVSVVRLV